MHLLLLFFFYGAFASTTYYFSQSGSDSNTAIQAQDIATPWKTLDKFNELSLQPGDSVLFKRGDSFFGKMIISSSGTAANPIVIGSYGSGENPLIHGFETVTEWSMVSTGIYSSSSSNFLSSMNMLIMDGNQQAMGRIPKFDDGNGLEHHFSFSTLL